MINHLDEVRHSEVDDFVTPGKFENNVGMEKVVTLVQTAGEAIVIALLQEPGEELFSDFGVLGLGRVFHGVLVQLVLLAQFD